MTCGVGVVPCALVSSNESMVAPRPGVNPSLSMTMIAASLGGRIRLTARVASFSPRAVRKRVSPAAGSTRFMSAALSRMLAAAVSPAICACSVWF